MEILLIGLPICALVGGLIGKSKGDVGAGVALGLVLGPIGWLIVYLGNSTGMRKCPFCAEEVKSEAIVCRFCSRDLPKMPTVTTDPRTNARPLRCQQEQPQMPSSKLIWMAGLTALAIVAIIYAVNIKNSDSFKEPWNASQWPDAEQQNATQQEQAKIDAIIAKSQPRNE
jgi:hypothetical protein